VYSLCYKEPTVEVVSRANQKVTYGELTPTKSALVAALREQGGEGSACIGPIKKICSDRGRHKYVGTSKEFKDSSMQGAVFQDAAQGALRNAGFIDLRISVNTLPEAVTHLS
jgi:hypothetical protein